MTIRSFQPRDIEAASFLAFDAWMKEDLPGHRSELGRFVYGYMARYYFRNSEYSRIASVDGKSIDAFLLAYRPEDETQADVWFDANIGFLKVDEQRIALQYRTYLKTQSHRLSDAAQGHYLVAGLFVSCKKGAGAPLMQKLLEQCEAEGYEGLYLWADSACNHTYYEKRGFERVAHHRDCEFVDGQKFDIFVFRKSF